MVWGNWITACRRIKVDNTLTSYTKNKFEWVKILNVQLKPQKEAK